ncbi:MAG: hypothetical protein WAV12_05435 [Trebonia sp.]|uniref:hypothetical protein n=1 Tax=Trebonia sp. TaxID=2767075 RepID=UPI003BB0598C
MSRTRSLVGLTAVTHLARAAVAEFSHTKPDEDARQHPLRLYRTDIGPRTGPWGNRV